jgi:hypothetical protein
MPLHTVAKGVSDSWLGGAACVSVEFFAMPMSTDIVFGPEFAEGFWPLPPKKFECRSSLIVHQDGNGMKGTMRRLYIAEGVISLYWLSS